MTGRIQRACYSYSGWDSKQKTCKIWREKESSVTIVKVGVLEAWNLKHSEGIQKLSTYWDYYAKAVKDQDRVQETKPA